MKMSYNIRELQFARSSPREAEKLSQVEVRKDDPSLGVRVYRPESYELLHQDSFRHEDCSPRRSTSGANQEGTFRWGVAPYLLPSTFFGESPREQIAVDFVTRLGTGIILRDDVHFLSAILYVFSNRRLLMSLTSHVHSGNGVELYGFIDVPSESTWNFQEEFLAEPFELFRTLEQGGKN